MDFNYQVETGPDGVRWVSIEPLMQDIIAALEGLMNIDDSKLDDEGKHILEMKILGLRTVHEFLGSIVTADNLKKIKGTTNEEETTTVH